MTAVKKTHPTYGDYYEVVTRESVTCVGRTRIALDPRLDDRSPYISRPTPFPFRVAYQIEGDTWDYSCMSEGAYALGGDVIGSGSLDDALAWLHGKSFRTGDDVKFNEGGPPCSP